MWFRACGLITLCDAHSAQLENKKDKIEIDKLCEVTLFR